MSTRKKKKGTLGLVSHSPEQTRELGVRLGELVQPGDVILLAGNLGSGKTCLTQGLAWGLGVKEYASSPSFVLAREYHGRLALYHMDFYRLDRAEEIVDLGIEEYIDSDGVTVIEWADKGTAVLPAENLLIRMGYISETARSLTLQATGERYLQLMESLRQSLRTWN